MTAPTAIDELLAAQGLVILDGALATELQARGAELDDALWSARLLIDRPEMIRQLHLDYFLAGADVATSASYQASFDGFARLGLDTGQAADLMRSAVRLAVEARELFWADPANRRGRRKPLVAASVGPYGACLADGSEYRGNYSLGEAELAAFHRPRLEVLAYAGADLLACETLPCLAEARVLARLLADIPGCAAWISFCCRDGGHNAQGEAVEDCMRELRGFDNIHALGLNCTAPEHVASLLARMAAVADKPLLAYPNSGESYDAAGKRWQACGTQARGLADQAADWVAAGARLIGGCCRTSPNDIRALRARLLPGSGCGPAP